MSEETGGLPSESGMSEYAQENMKEGKWFGKFDTVDDLAKSYRELEVVHTNKMREVSDENKAREADAIAKEEANQATQIQNELVKELMPEYMSNGMELTEEQEQKLVDSGVDIRDVKIRAMELKERIGIAHQSVGGQENYSRMIEWANEALTDKQKASFDKDVVSSAGEFAIKGLYSEFLNSTGQNTQRIAGSNNVSTSVSGYKSKGEMLKDRGYLNTFKGKNDVDARAKFNARMNATDDKVIFGR